MKQTNLWKFFFILFVLAWSLWELYPPKPRNLVMVFTEKAENTDSNFLAIAQRARELEGQFPERSFANLTNAIGTNDISRYFPRIDLTKHPAKNPNRAVLHELQRSAAGQIKLGLDLQGGMSFLVAMDTNKLTNVSDRQRALEQAAEVLRKRVDRFGVAEPVIQPAGENQILIQLPGLSEAEKETARTTIGKAAFLEFRIVHPDNDELIREDIVPVKYVRLTEVRKDRNGREIVTPFIVHKDAERGLTGKYIRNATVSQNPFSGALEIDFTLNSAGAELFSQITREYSPRNDKYFLLAIVLDGELYSAPRINGPIDGGRAQITGSFTAQEAFALANVLQNPLEAPVTVISENSVDPTLGKDSIRSGVRAAVIGTILVSAFMLVYYLLAGLVANVALILNIIILLGVMCYIDTALTLPGIAGIVLTIGMAVDANVLIFERIREELAAGKSMRGGLAAGYNKAFGTIFDSNLTTLIASVLLIFLGTGPVKGFGVTLTIGIVISMFTALFVTRLFFDVLLQAGRLKSLRMIQFVKTTHIDFLRWSKPAFALSWLMILIGIGYGFKRGKSVWGVDFAGGDAVTLSFKQEPDVEKIRSAITTLGVGEPQIQFSRDITGTSQKTLQVTTSFGSSDKVVRELQTRFPEAGFTPIATAKHGPTVGREIQKSALLATFLAMFGILIYVAFRYEFSFAVGAVVAIVHDVLMTIGWYCLTGREFNAPMVAALLTIIGFSINDTIVIFDRIREDLKLGIRGSFKDLINFALNQTLSRTIITSGTVLLATLSLYIFGGPVINDFAFTFLVGILSGTYSTIYIASALVLWWHKGARPKSGGQVTVGAATTAAHA